MKIKKIKKIKNFGTFNDFQWQNNCQEFEQFNFFYGWNYSGKTTLSRIFRCLELKKLHDNYQSTEFTLETDERNFTQKDLDRDYPIRVFNEDFVEDNFQWNNEDAKIDPVLILGKEAKDLENEAKELSKQIKEKKDKFEKTKEKKENIERNLERFLTDKASEIRNILGITNPRDFDKNKLEKKINGIKDTYQRYILSSLDKNNLLKIYGSKKLEEVTFESPQLKLTTFISDVNHILSKKVTAEQVIEKLKESPKLSEWVKEGIELHKNERTCQFCGNPLSPERLRELNEHFSKGFNDLMNLIKQKEEEISNHIKDIEKLNLPDKARLFEDLQSKFEISLKSLTVRRNNYVQTLESLKEELKRKREKPFDSLEIQKLQDSTIELKNAFEEIKSITDEHNSKVASFETEKQKVKDDLINCFTAKFIGDKSYFSVKTKIEELQSKIKKLEIDINELKKQIEHINEQVKAEAIGADRIDEYLRQFFNDNKLRIETTDDGKYKLYRNDQIAKNLSMGEKNIVSLVYFFAKLEETRFNLRDAVIFIDDPVSSLDSNHIFKIYGFIYEKLSNCSQLFITTHNFDFFNLLKDLGRHVSGNDQKVRYYLVKKNKNKEKEYSDIENLPDILLKHKSEYNYLFYILKLFNESSDNSEKYTLIYTLPNILRRFFEAYLFMKYPDGKKFKEKAKIFLKDENVSDKQKALKLMDEYSHEQNPTLVQKMPDVEEVSDAVRFILNTINKKDKEHYEALNKSLNGQL